MDSLTKTGSKSLKTTDSQTLNSNTKAGGTLLPTRWCAFWLFFIYGFIDKRKLVKIIYYRWPHRRRWVLITEGIGKGKSINFWRLQYEPKKYFSLEAVRRAVVRKQTYRKV